MNTKSILFASCVAAITLSASVAMAGGHGFGGGGARGGGFGGGGARGGGFRGGAGFAGMRPGFARAGSRFGPGTFGATAIFAIIAGSVIGSSSSATLVIHSFTIRFT